MNYTVQLTDTAKQDLREIAIWLAEQAQDIEIGKGFVNEIRAECAKIQLFPHKGSLPRDYILKSMGYRFTVYKDYLIFYLVEEDQAKINVMAIFNAKRDYMRVMRRFI